MVWMPRAGHQSTTSLLIWREIEKADEVEDLLDVSRWKRTFISPGSFISWLFSVISRRTRPSSSRTAPLKVLLAIPSHYAEAAVPSSPPGPKLYKSRPHTHLRNQRARRQFVACDNDDVVETVQSLPDSWSCNNQTQFNQRPNRLFARQML